jgi:hypothetical protein
MNRNDLIADLQSKISFIIFNIRYRSSVTGTDKVATYHSFSLRYCNEMAFLWCRGVQLATRCNIQPAGLFHNTTWDLSGFVWLKLNTCMLYVWVICSFSTSVRR